MDKRVKPCERETLNVDERMDESVDENRDTWEQMYVMGEENRKKKRI